MSIRITGGTHRGHRLRSTRSASLRPTSDKVRGAIFSILGAETVEGARVLDLYAGTGALGIEALSRNAAWVDFVEANARQSLQIRENLRALSLSARGKVYQARAERVLIDLSGGYDVVFADPPYNTNVWDELMSLLNSEGVVKGNGLVVAEHRHDTSLSAEYGRLGRVSSRRYGDTAISIYRAVINGG
jgi:16S rRNA (guanine966-N2)-methyltransferase